MAEKKEKLKRESETARRRPIQLITENGFSVVRRSDLEGAAAPATGTHAFLVRDPNDHELEISVEIEPGFRDEIVLKSRGLISSESSYWICCAERHLANYLSEQDDYPPDATLKVNQLTPDDLNLARRWDCDS